MSYPSSPGKVLKCSVPGYRSWDLFLLLSADSRGLMKPKLINTAQVHQDAKPIAMVDSDDAKPSASSESPERFSAASVFMGRIVGREIDGRYLVTYDGCPTSKLPARATTHVGPEDIGREVTLAFIDGKPEKPVISGVFRDDMKAPSQVAVSINGERLALAAERELVLQCGKSTVLLREDGYLLLRGVYLVSRASGPNHIKGSSVEVN